MTRYNSLNVKLSNSQINKIKSAIKTETRVVLRLSLNIVSDGETNFSHKLLLTDRQVQDLRKAFVNKLSTDINQKLDYLRWYNQADFLVDFLVHY